MADCERTLRMKQEYIKLHFEDGLSPKEIAKKFNLDQTTVYRSLQEIADANGFSRQELLDYPHERPVTYDRRFEPVEKPDTEAIRVSLEAMLLLADNQLEKIRQAINSIEEGEERE